MGVATGAVRQRDRLAGHPQPLAAACPSQPQGRDNADAGRGLIRFVEHDALPRVHTADLPHSGAWYPGAVDV